MAFTATEKVRIRYHLGYPNTTSMSSIQLGIPKPLQTMFLLEAALNIVIPEAEAMIRGMLQTLDNIECKMIEGQDYLPANRIGNLEVRKEHIAQLEQEYKRWAFRMANALGCPIYPFAERFSGVRVGNVKVTG